MVKLESLGKVIETDVLVLGGGISGLWAANRAKEFVDRVTVVDKGPRDWGGLASMSGGGMIAVLPEENVDDFVKDLVYYYDGFCEQDLVEEIFKHSFDRIKDYQRLGCEFLTEPDGKLKGVPQRGLDHVKAYVGKPFGQGGKSMVEAVVGEARKLGVQRLGRTMVTDLLKHDGAVAGAVGFNTINGEFYIFEAGAVVLATGNGSWKTSYGRNTGTGEGIDVALRASTELSNFEFVRVWNIPKLFSWEGQTYLLPLGARFVNAKGESFMDKYSPILGANTDPHYVVRAMAIEAREGRGPFYLDCSRIKPEDRELITPKADWMVLNYERLKELGMSFFEQKLEWGPQLRLQPGGVKADLQGRTSVSGLFVAGGARTFEPGVYMGGWSLCQTAVTGHITGGAAAEYAKWRKPLQINEDEVKALKSHLYAPLGKAGVPAKEVVREIQEAVFPYDVCILKNEKSLKKALAKIENIRDELLPQTGAKDAHYLMKLIEARGMRLHTELFLRASLMRTESRAGHYREDHPDRDDKNWLKSIIISRKGEELSLRTEPLPLEKYKFKPTRYYMDNFKFPNPK